MIPAEAVEAALEAYWANEEEQQRVAMQRALEAVVPKLAAHVWDMAYELGRQDERMKHTGLVRGNPYRTAP